MARSFDEQLQDPDAGVASDLDVDSDVLMVFFNGVIAQRGQAPFEFARITSDLGVKRLFLRDTQNSWYHAGVAGVSTNIEGTGAYLAEVAAIADARRVIYVGCSAGGYGALLHGALVGPDSVVAFSPQTFIDRWNRLRFADRRGRRRIPAFRKRFPRAPMQDLRPVLASHPGTTRYDLYHGSIRLDRIHARRLEPLPGVRRHELPVHKHLVVKAMRESGELSQILEAAVREG